MAFCRVTSSSSSPADARRIKSSMRSLSSYDSSGRRVAPRRLTSSAALPSRRSDWPAPAAGAEVADSL
eukprot:3477202-Pleurochrysis_carterae.AAC.1